MSEFQETLVAADALVSNLMAEADGSSSNSVVSPTTGDEGKHRSRSLSSPSPTPNGVASAMGDRQRSSTVDHESIPEEPSPTAVEPSGVSGEQQKVKSRPLVVSNVLMQLEQLIISDDWTRKNNQPAVTTAVVADSAADETSKKRKTDAPRLNELGRSLVTSYSMKAYIDLLGSHHRQSIANWLYGNTCAALSTLFHYPHALAHFSDDPYRGGISQAVKMALRWAYPELSANGFREYEAAPPVVYVSPALHFDVHQFLTQEFGITNIVVLPRLEGPLAGVEGRLDQTAFEKQVDEDVAEGRLPLLVIAVVGSAIFGQNDLVSKLIEVRQRHRFWLHVYGQGLAALALPEPSEHLIQVLQQVDSMQLPLGQWLGLPAVQSLTLRRPVDSYRVTYREKLDSLQWWVATQHLSLRRISDMIEFAYRLSKLLLSGLSHFKRIEILGVPNVADYAAKVIKGSYFPPTVIIFKYSYRSEAVASSDESEQGGVISETEMEYMDSLNSWLGQGLIGECRLLGLHLVELGGAYGTAFRFCPLESAASYATRAEHVSHFVKHLGDTLGIVGATVRARRSLDEILSEYPSLCRMPIQKWAGVGAICYIPSIVADTPASEWNDKQKQQVSHLNIELVHSLRGNDSAFSTGESDTNVSCVKFGMLADEKDLLDLVSMVAERGKQIEESSKYLESLATMVKQGIDAANEDLRKESEQKLMQEGVLRQLPMVGSLINWWSPMGNDGVAGTKGRAFDLKTGRIQATDVIYKHKLQIEVNEGTADAGAELTPATPIDTPQAPHGIAGLQTTTDDDDAPSHSSSEQDDGK